MNRKSLVVISQVLIVLAFSLPFLFGWTHPTLLLLGMATISALGPLIVQGALDSIQQLLPKQGEIQRVTAIAGGLRQSGMVAGGGVGLLIANTSVNSTLSVIIAICVLSCALCIFLPNTHKLASSERADNFPDTEGLSASARRHSLFRPQGGSVLDAKSGSIFNAD